MRLKTIVKQLASPARHVPFLIQIAMCYFDRRSTFPGWNRQHPYDRLHGVETSGYLPGFLLAPGAVAYGAAQPSIIRTALAAIPEPQRCHFLDLGCGKGRPLLVAAEFGFSVVTGVEFSSVLSRVARRNAAIVSRTHPDWPRINVVTGDALAIRLPEQDLVIFLYNPFGERQITRLLERVEASLRIKPRDLYIVYDSPVWAEVLDRSTVLERRFAAQLNYDHTELGYGPDDSDDVAIWQRCGN